MVTLLNAGVQRFENGANLMVGEVKMPLEGLWRADIRFPRGTLGHTVMERMDVFMSRMDVFIAYDPVQMHYRGQSSIVDQRALGIELLDEHKGYARVHLHLLHEAAANETETLDAVVTLAKNGSMLVFMESNNAPPFATLEKK